MPKRRFRRWIFGVCGILGSILLAGLTFIAVLLLVIIFYLLFDQNTAGGKIERLVWEFGPPSVLTGFILALIVLIIGIVYTIDRLCEPTNSDPKDDLKCPQCNYDMRGSIAADNYDCPECGARYESNDEQIKIIPQR